MYTENILRNRLNSLIENGLLSYDVLAKATDIEKNRIENYLSGKCNALSENDIENIKYELRLANIADLLIEGMQVSEDDRVIGIIDVLIQIYGMTYEMIAGYTGIDANEIIDFVNKEHLLSVEKKYKLAVKVFSIVQAFFINN